MLARSYLLIQKLAFLSEDLLEVTRYETGSNSLGNNIGSFFPQYLFFNIDNRHSFKTFSHFPTNICELQLSKLEPIQNYNLVPPPANQRFQQWHEENFI